MTQRGAPLPIKRLPDRSAIPPPGEGTPTTPLQSTSPYECIACASSHLLDDILPDFHFTCFSHYATVWSENLDKHFCLCSSSCFIAHLIKLDGVDAETGTPRASFRPRIVQNLARYVHNDEAINNFNLENCLQCLRGQQLPIEDGRMIYSRNDFRVEESDAYRFLIPLGIVDMTGIFTPDKEATAKILSFVREEGVEVGEDVMLCRLDMECHNRMSESHQFDHIWFLHRPNSCE